MVDEKYDSIYVTASAALRASKEMGGTRRGEWVPVPLLGAVDAMFALVWVTRKLESSVPRIS